MCIENIAALSFQRIGPGTELACRFRQGVCLNHLQVDQPKRQEDRDTEN